MILDRMKNSSISIVIFWFCFVLNAVTVTDVGNLQAAGVSMPSGIPVI
jgi:hypothetical protein